MYLHILSVTVATPQVARGDGGWLLLPAKSCRVIVKHKIKYSLMVVANYSLTFAPITAISAVGQA